MKVPTWASVVGVLMILLGGCGVLNNVQKINTPKALDQSSGLMEEISKGIEEVVQEEHEKNIQRDSLNQEYSELIKEDSAGGKGELQEVLDSVESMMYFSDYYKKWIVRLGILGAIVSLIYATAGVILIIGKPVAIKLVYLAIVLSYASLIFQIAILAMDDESGMIAGMTNFGSYFMIFVNTILLVIILASDKSYFYQHTVIEE